MMKLQLSRYGKCRARSQNAAAEHMLPGGQVLGNGEAAVAWGWRWQCTAHGTASNAQACSQVPAAYAPSPSGRAVSLAMPLRHPQRACLGGQALGPTHPPPLLSKAASHLTVEP